MKNTTIKLHERRGVHMKTTKLVVVFMVMGLMLGSLTACNNISESVKANGNSQASTGDEISEQAKEICGSWAYIHDKATEVAQFNEDGSAMYEGKVYTFDCDDTFVTLTSTDGETTKLRYEVTDEGMNLYSNNTYTYIEEGTPDSIIGQWECKDKKWTYYFTDKGTFMEDGCFPGHYTVDSDNSTFTLVYNDPFDDTVCWFKLDGNKLTIEYPWPMVHTEK